MKSKTFHICVARSRRIKAGKSRFSGIMRYAAERRNWIVRIVDPVRADANYYPISNELAADATCDVFLDSADAQTDNISQLADWLAHLPLPCGVMAYNDSRAQTVIDACRMAHLKIPDQIQVVGVDNEVEICENTFPTLTSILPDFEGSGYLAAQLLDKMLTKGRPNHDAVYTYGVKTVVERASTQDLRGGGRLVTQACEFMRLHAGEKIDVDSVAKAQKVSRRTLEMRFREIMDEGVGEVLRRHRLERVCKLLKETHRSISDISYDSGFASPTYLKAAFKKAYGKTMGEWRHSDSCFFSRATNGRG